MVLNSAKALLGLQELDQQLAVKRSAYKKVQGQLESEGDRKRLAAECEKAAKEVAEARAAHLEAEAEITGARDRVQTIEGRLYGGAVTSVRELTALEEEHRTAKRNLAQAEESLGPARRTVEEAEERLAYLHERLSKAEEEWRAAEAALRQQAAALAEECSEIESTRSVAAATIPKEDLTLYSSLLYRKSGVAVARVERGVCQGCRIKLPMREIARLKNSDQLAVCSSCGRILMSV